MSALVVFIWCFLLLRLLVAAVNLITKQWLRFGYPSQNALVSVLIPARNEAHNIKRLLEKLKVQEYPHVEILVYDDLSTDNTAQIVKKCMEEHPRLRLLEGKPLPNGWLGKNHACHRLAGEARGDLLLFLDADVQPEKTLIRDALGHMEKYKLDLLSIFPRQRTVGFGEKVSVPLMNWILVSLLPLICTKICKNPALSAANGQFMLFKSNTYHKHGFHEMFKTHAVEDIAIFKKMKTLGLNTHTILSNGQIQCRMYASLKESVTGFSKNMLAFFGHNALLAFGFALITTFGLIPVWLTMGTHGLAVYLFMVSLLRILTSWASKQSVWMNVFLAPLQQVILNYMVFKSIYNKINKKNTWKGRNIDF